MNFSLTSHSDFIILAYGTAFVVLAGCVSFAEWKRRRLRRQYEHLKKRMQTPFRIKRRSDDTRWAA